jgi:hypothetical protein
MIVSPLYRDGLHVRAYELCPHMGIAVNTHIFIQGGFQYLLQRFIGAANSSGEEWRSGRKRIRCAILNRQLEICRLSQVET